MGIQTYFDNFHNKIKLGREDDAYKKARERDDSIKKEILTEFENAGYPVVRDFIQGSLKTHTGIKPISGDYDIDRALTIDEKNAPKNPVTPKKKVLEVLNKRGFKNAKIKKPCVTADYTKDNIHIDFAIYKKFDDNYYLAVGKENSDKYNREWASADPNGLIEWINDSSNYYENQNASLSQFRRLVRYLKRWRDVKFSDSVASKIFSIGLTVMVKEQFMSSFNNEGYKQDLQALYNTVDAILNAGYFTEVQTGRYGINVNLPVQPWQDIFNGSSLDTGTQFYNKLKSQKKKLAEAIDTDEVHKQCRILNELFGGDFKIPENNSLLRTATVASTLTPVISFGNEPRSPQKPRGFA